MIVLCCFFTTFSVGVAPLSKALTPAGGPTVQLRHGLPRPNIRFHSLMARFCKTALYPEADRKAKLFKHLCFDLLATVLDVSTTPSSGRLIYWGVGGRLTELRKSIYLLDYQVLFCFTKDIKGYKSIAR